MKRLLTLVILLFTLLSVEAQQAKYIFYFIGDGMGISHIRGTEIYNAAVNPDMESGGRLSFTRFPVHTLSRITPLHRWLQTPRLRLQP